MSGKNLGKGIDIGGISVKIGIVDEDCCIVDKRVIPTDSRIKTQAEVAEAIAEAVCRLAEENHIQMNVMFARAPLGENAKVLSQGGLSHSTSQAGGWCFGR